MSKRQRVGGGLRRILWLLIAVAVLATSLLGLWSVRKPVVAWWNGLFRHTDTQALPPDSVVFHFIDVGQGDCTLITTPAGNVLVDTGSNASEGQLRTYLADVGVTDFAWVILTHPDEDHIGAADMILSNYAVECVLLPDMDDASLTYRRMTESLAASGATRVIARAGMDLSVGDMRMTVLSPLPGDNTDANDGSIVLRVVYGGASALLTGDAGLAAEAALLNVYPAGDLRSDLLKVGHHGADTSTSEAFLGTVSPQMAVISVGAGNGYDHPRAQIVARLETAGITVYRTDINGTVRLATDGQRWYGRE